MSYAIIRNTKYKSDNLKGVFRHNERRNKNYSNENIDKEKSYLNYSIKQPRYTYEKEFERIRKECDLKGQIKTVSNIACEYIITSDKDLGEKYILSAKVHMDEQTPHMYLVFLPVVHTKDRKGNEIDKLACSEFWKEKDSYRRLQDAFYEYVTTRGFDLERGLTKEETGRENIDLKKFKEITNFEKTKETLKNIKLEIPNLPEINNISKFSLKRDEKIMEEIIKPKDEIINQLYNDNRLLHQELTRQAKIAEKAEKYEKERSSIISDNEFLYNQVDSIKKEYKEKEFDLEWKYKKENSRLNRIIDKFYETIDKFIHWICKKFDMGAEDDLVKNFEKETNTLLDAEKQIKKEDRE